LINSEKVTLVFDTEMNVLSIDDFDFSYPGEYEKSGILVEVKEYANNLFHHVFVDEKHIVFIQNDKIELKEEILSFFGDVDVLVIIGSKDAAKLFESIEAKIVVPFGEGKDVFLNTLGQHIEEVSSHKIKAELPFDTTEFINLEIV
ncbi:MAG: hypothetical protein GY828_03730, partial [Candidatus Gracilibacteria bacterium]|nr:hypothetical protein [Candidatus Gracilibacteria bacterium]